MNKNLGFDITNIDWLTEYFIGVIRGGCPKSSEKMVPDFKLVLGKTLKLAKAPSNYSLIESTAIWAID